MKDAIEYPNLAEYCHLTNLLDPTTWRLNKVVSKTAWSDASITNQILADIEKRSGVYAYFNNRVQEMVGVSMLKVMLHSETVFLSQTINDVYYGIDVILKAQNRWCAVDLTSNPGMILAKVDKGRVDGEKALLWPDGSLTKLPFIVIYTAQIFHHSVAKILEWNAQNQELSKSTEEELTTLAIQQSLWKPEVAELGIDGTIYSYANNKYEEISVFLREKFRHKVSDLTSPWA